MTKSKVDSNIVMSGNRKATKEEIDNAMLLLTGTRSKAPSEVLISIPEMDKAFNVYCEGIRGLHRAEEGLVSTFATQFEVSFGQKDWYELESKGKLGVGVRAYKTRVVDFLDSLGRSNGYGYAQWLMIKKASGYMTPAMIASADLKVAEAQKTADERGIPHITALLNLINKSDVDIKLTPYKAQLESMFFNVAQKMFK